MLACYNKEFQAEAKPLAEVSREAAGRGYLKGTLMLGLYNVHMYFVMDIAFARYLRGDTLCFKIA